MKNGHLLPEVFFSYFGNKCVCFDATVNRKMFKGLDMVKSKFWNSVLVAWLENNSWPREDNTNVLWNNRLVTYRGNVLYFHKWVEAGILVVNDVLTQTGTCLSYDEIRAKIGNFPSCQLEYNVVQSAVNAYLVTNRENDPIHVTLDDIPLFCGKRLTTVKQFRKQLTEKNTPSLLHSILETYIKC